MPIMSNIINTLKTRYETALQSDSDSSFYKNIHAYIDHIVKTPVFSAIMDKSEKEYHEGHSEIWRIRKSTEYELDYQSALTDRVENLSLYAGHYIDLFVRIYSPMEEYIHPSPGLEDKLDPVALLMVKGLKRTEETGLWSKEKLRVYNNWFKGGMREYYTDELKKFHLDFLAELEKLGIDGEEVLPELPKQKMPFSFNNRTGDFVFHDLKGTLSLGTQEFKVFSTLYTSPDYQADYLTLLKSYNPGVETASKTYRDNLSLIIRNLKERFNILPSTKTSNPDIFLNIKKFGYRLIFSPTDKET